MREDRVINVLARIEDERVEFENGNPDALGFNMSTWYSVNEYAEGDDDGYGPCGTVACLAGHACYAAGLLVPGQIDFRGIAFAYEGAKYLGLTDEQANHLFNLSRLLSVYREIAHYMGVDEQVLRDKVAGERGLA